MKIYKKINIFSNIFNICIFLLCIIIFNFNTLQRQLGIITNNLYSLNATSFFVQNINEWKNAGLFELEQLFLECEPGYRIYLSNNTKWTPPLISGAFFDNSKTANYAVVGNSMQHLIKTVQNETVIKYNGETYKVTGIMGTDFPSKIDYLVILSNSNIPKKIEYNVILDGASKSDIAIKTEKIKEVFPNLDSTSKDYTGLSKLNGIKLFQTVVTINAFLIITFTIIAFYLFWYIKKESLIIIYYQLGINKYKILYYLILQYISGFIFPFLLIIFISLLNISFMSINFRVIILLVCIFFIGLLVLSMKYFINAKLKR